MIIMTQSKFVGCDSIIKFKLLFFFVDEIKIKQKQKGYV